VITATGLELRAGSRVLIDDATFRVGPGDRVGLVGRNGAGKTTLTRILAGESRPATGTVTRTGEVGYLPQDPRTGDLDVLARDRILSARELDSVLRQLRETEGAMASADDETRELAMER
jgi:ATPase subunit of ABC transporter with duplicated ATPase domains